MTKTVNHIISRFRWNTSFDEKERVYELQESISFWSRNHMPREINTVFDQICSSGQTLRIQSIELDLGIIDFHNLYNELSSKLSQKLRETLMNLILYPGKGGQQIKILHEDMSSIDMLRTFLLQGVIPWSHTAINGSVHQILAMQLRDNQKKVIAVIREIGVNEYVRRRIAWQVRDDNMFKIIEGLAPNNHSQIVDFSNEFIKIQHKETLVQTAGSDFKKNVWFWVLNHLLTERGTLFNKIAFVRSTILQMANHYNVDYHELFGLIEQVIDTITEDSHMNNEFIVVLKTLSLEHKSAPHIATKRNKDTIDFWSALERYFLHPSLRKKASKKTEFNELIISLAKQDKKRLETMILSLYGGNVDRWLNTIEDVTDTALEIIYSSLLSSSSHILITVIQFLDQSGLKKVFKTDQKTVRQIALSFALTHRKLSFDTKTILQYYITALSEKSKESRETVLGRLANLEILSSVKRLSSITMYNNLNTIISNELAVKNALFSEEKFNTILDKLMIAIEKKKNQQQSFIELQKSFLKWIRLLPVNVLDLLTLYPNKKQLITYIPLLLDEYDAEVLIENSKKESSSVLLAFRDSIHSSKVEKGNTKVIMTLEGILMTLGLQISIGHPISNKRNFLELLIEALAKKISQSDFPDFILCIQEVLQHKKIKSLGFSEAFLEKLQVRFKKKKRLFGVALITQIIETRTDGQRDIAKILATELHAKKINNKEFLDKKNTILKYLLPKGETLKQDLITEYTKKIAQKLKNSIAKEIYQELEIIYWRCIADFSCYNGDIDRFKKVFARAVLYRFSVVKEGETCIHIEKPLITPTAKEKHIYPIKNGIKIPILQKEALIIQNDSFKTVLTASQEPSNDIQQCADKNKTEELCYHILMHHEIPSWFAHQKGSTPNQVLHEIIQHYPLVLFKVIKDKVICEAGIHRICHKIELSTIIISIGKLYPIRQKQLDVLEKFHIALASISLSGISARAVQHILFQKIVKAWATDNWRMVSPEYIWNELLWEICSKTSVSKQEFFEALYPIRILLPATLQISYDITTNIDKGSTTQKEKLPEVLLKKVKNSNEEVFDLKEGIAIKNAGLVLLSTYILMLFERLDIIRDNDFKNEDSRLDAVHYLQYLVTGFSSTEESFLPLNKILCGLPVTHPVKDGVQISEAHKELINGMINAATGYWSAIGTCSIDGFRGNWLVRDGVLTEEEDRWQLTVEKRSYDVLIHQSPFSFSIIKLPWMDKPLYVTWPY